MLTVLVIFLLYGEMAYGCRRVEEPDVETACGCPQLAQATGQLAAGRVREELQINQIEDASGCSYIISLKCNCTLVNHKTFIDMSRQEISQGCGYVGLTTSDIPIQCVNGKWIDTGNGEESAPDCSCGDASSPTCAP